MAELTDIVGKTKNVVDVAKKGKRAIIPILEKEDIGYHVNQIIDNYKGIRDAIKEKPYLRTVLEMYVRASGEEYKWILYGAKTVDSIDRLTAVIELGAGVFGPEAEIGVKAVTEPLEWVLKVPYSAYYTIKSGDYVAPLYFLAAEAASLVPYLGEVVDAKNIYTNRARSQMQKKAAKNFLENIVNTSKKT